MQIHGPGTLSRVREGAASLWGERQGGSGMEKQQNALIDGYDRSARRYDETAGMMYLQALWALVPFVNVSPFPAILDAGCGTGINLVELSHLLRPCGPLVGVDLSAGMLEVARRKAASAGIDASLLLQDAEDLELEDERFDLVVCNSVYHWLLDRPRAIKGFARVLKPGGQLLISSVAHPSFQDWQELVTGVWADRFGNARPWFPPLPVPSELKSHLLAAGLSIEHFQPSSQRMVFRDIPSFVSTMEVVAPNWHAGIPEGSLSDLRGAVMDAIRTKFPAGLACTASSVQAVARKAPAAAPAAG